MGASGNGCSRGDSRESDDDPFSPAVRARRRAGSSPETAVMLRAPSRSSTPQRHTSGLPTFARRGRAGAARGVVRRHVGTAHGTDARQLPAGRHPGRGCEGGLPEPIRRLDATPGRTPARPFKPEIAGSNPAGVFGFSRLSGNRMVERDSHDRDEGSAHLDVPGGYLDLGKHDRMQGPESASCRAPERPGT